MDSRTPRRVDGNTFRRVMAWLQVYAPRLSVRAFGDMAGPIVIYETMSSLKDTASRNARFRGHVMTRWHDVTSKQSWAKCAECGAGAFVYTRKPPRPSVNISGSATTEDCVMSSFTLH